MEKTLTLSKAYVAFRSETGVKPVLTDLSVTLTPGEWLTVVGRNGSGKSTLLRVLSGLLPLSKGDVAWSREAARAMALVLQNPEAQLIGETVREDLYFTLENRGVDPAVMPKLALSALERVGLAGYLDASVNGLSHGQKQLLAVAGGLALHARLLLFDEASSMLDPLAAQHLFNAIKELQSEGATIVWVTQHMEELYLADRVLALEHGKQAFLGTPQEFLYGAPSGSDAPIPPSPCESLGFQAPYAVQTAGHLAAQGVFLDPLPLTIADLVGHPVLAVCFGREETAG